jgi:hypothetical protein
MAAKLEKTRTPGTFKRGSRYVFSYRANGSSPGSPADKTVKNIVGPLRTCLATATREGLIRSNPARDVDLPHRPTAEDSEEDEVKAMTRPSESNMAEWPRLQVPRVC